MTQKQTITAAVCAICTVISLVVFAGQRHTEPDVSDRTTETVTTDDPVAADSSKIAGTSATVTVTASVTPEVSQAAEVTRRPVVPQGAERTPQRITPPVQTTDTGSGSDTSYSLGSLSGRRIHQFSFSQPFTALGFSWSDGSFEYSLDGVVFKSPSFSDEHRPDGGTYKKASDLIFTDRSLSQLFIRADQVQGLEVHTIQPEAASVQTAAATQNYTGALFTTQNIISRENWGADENLAPWNPRYGPVSRLIVHHTAGSNTATDWAAVVRSIFTYHAVSLDWGDIGYNYLIDPNGVVYEGRKGGDGVTAAHAYLHNYGSIGISMIGTYSDGLPTDAARASLRRLLAEKAEVHNLPLAWASTVYGHRDFNSTSCPGTTLYNQMPVLTAAADGERLANMTDVAAATEATEDAFADWFAQTGQTYGDLIVTFNYPVSSPPSTIAALIPPYSGIEVRGVGGNKAYLRLNRYYDELGEPMLFRTRFLHTYFSLRPDVTSVEISGEYTILPITVDQTGQGN